MKAKGVGNKPAPYLLVFTLFLGAVYLSAIFRTEYFCRQEGSEFMAKSKGGVTVSKVWELCQPIVEGFGLSLWDVRYVKEGADRFLRVYIDKPEGIDINDCENVSRAINGPLDELDPIEEAYCLEVCSPGIERELIRDEHFMQFIGADIMVKMLRPIDGIGREFKGVLKSQLRITAVRMKSRSAKRTPHGLSLTILIKNCSLNTTDTHNSITICI